MLHHGQTASCQDSNLPAGLDCLLPPGTPPLCSRLGCLHCTSPGVPVWRHASIPWIRLTVVHLGTSGVVGPHEAAVMLLLVPRPVLVYRLLPLLHSSNTEPQEICYI